MVSQIPLITATRPIFHFTPPSNWMNDPNGTVYHEGYYHLFYQYNPSGDQWGDIHWGHARSQNLVDWERLPIALAPSTELGEKHCYSGCCLVDGNLTPRIFYTKVGGETEQWTAEGSSDLMKWTKGPNNPILWRTMPGMPSFDQDWRDPFVFEFRCKHYMILGAEVDDRSVVPLFEATDEKLLNWKFRGILFSADKSEIPYPECPNLFQSGDKWVLILSPYRRPHYFLGTLCPQTMEFSRECDGPFDGSNNFYATNIYLSEMKNEQVLVAWIRGFPAAMGWSGCLSLPRLVSVADGVVRQRPHPAIEALRATSKENRTEFEVPKEGFLTSPISPSLELNLHTETIKDGLEVLIRGSDSERELLKIRITREELSVGTETLRFASPLDSLSCSLFLDRSVVEIFVSSRYSLSTVAAIDDRDVILEVRNVDVPITLLLLKLWSLRAANFIDYTH